MKKITILLGACMVFAQVSTVLNGYSYIEDFTNSSSADVIMKSSDAGHASAAIKHRGASCTLGGNDNLYTKLDCLPFVVPAGATYTFDNMIVPWREIGGQTYGNNYILITLYQQSAQDINTGLASYQKKMWQILESQGNVYIYSSTDSGQHWQQANNLPAGQFSATIDSNNNLNLRHW